MAIASASAACELLRDLNGYGRAGYGGMNRQIRIGVSETTVSLVIPTVTPSYHHIQSTPLRCLIDLSLAVSLQLQELEEGIFRVGLSYSAFGPVIRSSEPPRIVSCYAISMVMDATLADPCGNRMTISLVITDYNGKDRPSLLWKATFFAIRYQQRRLKR